MRGITAILMALLLGACAAGVAGNTDPDAAAPSAARAVAQSAGGFDLSLAVQRVATVTMDGAHGGYLIQFEVQIRNIGDLDLQIDALEAHETSGDRVWRFDGAALDPSGTIEWVDGGVLTVGAGRDWRYTVRVELPPGELPVALGTRLRVWSNEGGTTLAAWLELGETLVGPAPVGQIDQS